MNFADIQSNKALVCHKDKVNDAGAGVLWFVLLGDGYLLDCGTGNLAERRANALAAIINEGHADKLGHDALKGAAS